MPLSELINHNDRRGRDSRVSLAPTQVAHQSSTELPDFQRVEKQPPDREAQRVGSSKA